MSDGPARPPGCSGYLASRTVAEMAGDGYDGLRIVCPGCRRMVCYPFRVLLATVKIGRREPAMRLANRLRCGVCARRPTPADVTAWRMADDQPP